MNKLLIIFFSLLLVTTACKKDDTTNTNPIVPATMDDLNVSSDFDWKITQDIQITITGNTNNMVKVTSLDGDIFQKAFIKANEPYIMELSIPSHLTSVKLQYMDQDVTLEIGNGVFSYKFQ